MPRYKGKEIAECNCGGPQYGTAHAPDCELILDATQVDKELRDEAFEHPGGSDYDTVGR